MACLCGAAGGLISRLAPVADQLRAQSCGPRVPLFQRENVSVGEKKARSVEIGRGSGCLRIKADQSGVVAGVMGSEKLRVQIAHSAARGAAR